MSILTTPNLGLLYPGEDNLINEHLLLDHNLSLLDTLIGDIGPHSYTPTFRAESGVQPNPGADAVFFGLWYRLLDIVTVFARLEWAGAGLTPGSGTGAYLMSLPVPVAGLIGEVAGDFGAGSNIGVGRVHDAGTVGNRQTCVVHPRQGSDEVYFIGERGNPVYRNDSPIVWATGDALIWTARYRGSFG